MQNRKCCGSEQPLQCLLDSNATSEDEHGLRLPMSSPRDSAQRNEPPRTKTRPHAQREITHTTLLCQWARHYYTRKWAAITLLSHKKPNG